MEITYLSPSGSFSADGGSGTYPLKIRSFEGLGLPSRSRNTVTYPGQAGQILVSSSFEARTITLALDLLLTGDEAKEYETKMLEAAREDGVLQIGDKEIPCSVAALSPSQICKGDYPKYAVQFICDYPYFRDSVPTTVNLFKRVNNIKSTFSFPLVLSTLDNDSRVFNGGQTAVEPVIHVQLGDSAGFELEGSGESSENVSKTFTLTNLTNGAVIELDLTDVETESLTVDIPNRRIYSPNEELTHLLADNLFMCDFVLVPGENRLVAKWGDGSVEVYAAAVFRQEYLGVVP